MFDWHSIPDIAWESRYSPPADAPPPSCDCSFLSANTDSEWWPHEPNCKYVLHMEAARERKKHWWIDTSKGVVREK